MLKYSTLFPDQPLGSITRSRFVVNTVTFRRPLKASSQRSLPCSTGVGAACSARFISAASSGRAFSRPSQLVVGSAWPSSRLMLGSGAASAPRTLLQIAFWTAKMSVEDLRRSCVSFWRPSMRVKTVVSQSPSRKEPAVSTEKPLMLAQRIVRNSMRLPVMPRTSMESSRFEVMTRQSRPCLKASSTCSSASRTGVAVLSWVSTAEGSSAAALAPR
mmetsp:Transcript_21236/g.56758  ORF Transcript_21236/g.56758 Transcript_21236/m.56758 type:complete len:216 (+) Transcript_21236:635-1282(+)